MRESRVGCVISFSNSCMRGDLCDVWVSLTACPVAAHEASRKVEKFQPPPDDCECSKHLLGLTEFVWFGGCLRGFVSFLPPQPHL